MRAATIAAAALLFNAAAQSAVAAEAGTAKFAGIAFVDSSVTGQGSRAKLPPGAAVIAPGSTVSGTTGCPTNRFGTDGLIVAVIDYEGRPNAASLQVIRHLASGGRFENAPYYLNVDPGRTLQFLGPIRENGTYELHLTLGLGQAKNEKADTTFTLARACPPPR